MRRIPRPQRSIDQALSLRSQNTSSLCRTALATSPYLRTTSASFSTSTRCHSILDPRNDKQKHKMSIRKWQKRLLGDSEPIGAHVDPYDATSPVRIAPEETGEEQEMLEEAEINEHGSVEDRTYYPAESGEKLPWVGTKRWVAAQKEEELEERFRILMGRPSHSSEHYKSIRFGRNKPVTKLPDLQKLFHRAAVEVYTLHQAGRRNFELTGDAMYSSHPSIDFTSVKLQYSPNDGVSLYFPEPTDRTSLLQNAQKGPLEKKVPRGSAVKTPQEMLVDEAEELVIEEPQVTAADVTVASTSGKPAALVKQTEGKPFDFMSNRPVPRTNAEEAAAQAAEAVAPVVKIEVDTATVASPEIVETVREETLKAAVRSAEREATAARREVRGHVEAAASQNITVLEPVVDVKYRHVPLTDHSLKFALSKRLLKLTGLRISDPHLNSCHTLGDLYANLIAASKPKPKKLFDLIKVEHQAKLISQSTSAVAIPETTPRLGAFYKDGRKQRPGVEQLVSLPNVALYQKRISPRAKDRQVGRMKVIDYALAERGLADVGTKDGVSRWLNKERREVQEV